MPLKQNSALKPLQRVLLIALLCLCAAQCAPQGSSWPTLPAQHKGRIKPFDSLARETLIAVYGKPTFKRKPAFEIILSWLLIPDWWQSADFIFVEKEIKKSLNLPLRQKHFSPQQLKSAPQLILQLRELQALRQRKESLDPYFQKLEKLENRLLLYEAARSGALIKLEPQEGSELWLSLRNMSEPALKIFQEILSVYVSSIAQSEREKERKTYETQQSASKIPLTQEAKKPPPLAQQPAEPKNKALAPAQSPQSLEEAMARFQRHVFKGQKEKRFSPLKIQAEYFYNKFNPFQKAWALYLLFLMALAIFYIFKRADLIRWALPLSAMGFACHSLGLALRSFIMLRPPVANMYETVVWVPWAAWLAGLIFWIKGSKISFIAGNLLAFFCLLVAGLSHDILNPELAPLIAVLNSSFWLATHVLIITMSYSFFFLSFVLGDMALISYLSKTNQPLLLAEKVSAPIYRSLQWGTALLAVGIVLGGIWADYSWGRFWGWDPKESWALVSLLGYLALLHARLSGKIKTFGLCVAAVMMFFSILMAWYGVNFILGQGLHSYGFGSGGVEYVASFAALHLALCALAILKKQGLPPFSRQRRL